jgi:DNA-binding winged helix-turn-helix (wHTH) protein/tetratricopeptide (TPR) repeat protein
MSLRLRQYYEFGPFRVDTNLRLLFRSGHVAPVPTKAFDILLILIRRKGEIVGRDEMIRAVWPEGLTDEGVLNFNIFRLRRILGDQGGKCQYVVTMSGQGYRFAGEVTETWEEEDNLHAATRAIAILPFKRLNLETEDYLGIGIADALITRLGSLRQIVVRPTSAVRAFEGENVDPLAVGRDLRVKSVLEGSVRRSGDRIELDVQLVDVHEKARMWSECFDESFGDIFSVEGWISEKVALSLAPQLTPKEKARLAKRYTESLPAYEQYLRGRYFWNRRSEEGIQKAIEFFDRAILIDPKYALAYTGLADCCNLLSFYSLQPPCISFPKAKAAAAKALELDDNLAEAHSSLAYSKLYYDWDWVGAEKEFRCAISLNPNYPPARQWYHEFLLAMGWYEEAMTEIRRASELDPLSPVINAALVLPLIHSGQHDVAIERLRRVIDLDPGFYRTHLFLGAAYTQKKEYSKAISEFQIAMILSDGSTRALAALGFGYAVSGKKRQAQKVIDDLLRRARERYVPAYAVAMIYAGLGDRDQAFLWLDKAVEERDEWLVRLKIAPELAALRPDPRFLDLARRVGLAP